MNRIVLPVVFLLIVMATSSRADAERHNIVLFLIDDLGWMDLGCQGKINTRRRTSTSWPLKAFDSPTLMPRALFVHQLKPRF